MEQQQVAGLQQDGHGGRHVVVDDLDVRGPRMLARVAPRCVHWLAMRAR